MRTDILPEESQPSSFVQVRTPPFSASRVAGDFRGREFIARTGEPLSNYSYTEPVPEALEFSNFDLPEKYFSGRSAKRTSRATLVPSYTKLFSSSIAAVAWAFQREDTRREIQKKIQRSRRKRKL